MSKAIHGHARVAIINTANRPWSIIQSDTLKRLFPEITFQEFYFSTGNRAFQPDGSQLDSAVICCGSLEELVDRLKMHLPSALYLRVSPHTRSEGIVTQLRRIFYDQRIVVEAYDMSCLFRKEALQQATYPEEAALMNALQGCDTALNECAALVLKMGGEGLTELREKAVSSLVIHYPVYLNEGIQPARQTLFPAEGEPRKILYAGSASAREYNGGLGSVPGANLMRYFECIENHPNLRLTILNAAHDAQWEDALPKFLKLVNRFTSPKSKALGTSYLRSMPFHQLLPFARQFDIGICCAHYENDPVEPVTRFSLPNRMTTYLSADLPIVIDSRFEFAADLVYSYGAGAVVEAGNFMQFESQLNTMDLASARRGVIRLKRHLADQNLIENRLLRAALLNSTTDSKI